MESTLVQWGNFFALLAAKPFWFSTPHLVRKCIQSIILANKGGASGASYTTFKLRTKHDCFHLMCRFTFAKLRPFSKQNQQSIS
jgi:hypothetical protein